MGRQEFENYGLRAAQALSATEVAGRYPSQVEGERQILVDIIEKLQISPKDTLIEIGCGPGQLLIPLSFLVESAVGVDHRSVCGLLKERYNASNLTLIEGNFLDLGMDNLSFNKIILYSVLQTLTDEDEVLVLVTKALSLLEPGGRMLIGDIPNVDKKARFQSTDSGKAFEEEWRSQNLSASNVRTEGLLKDEERVIFSDEIVSKLVLKFRKMGFHSYLLPQPDSLPWGKSREDLLVVRPH